MADALTPELAKQLISLSDKRDLAAYNCVNAIQFVLSMFGAEEFEKSREYLQDALDQHKRVDDAIAEFHRNLRKSPQPQTSEPKEQIA